MGRQKRDILEPLTQGRQFNYYGADSVIKILTKITIIRIFQQVSFCRRNNSDINGNFFNAAYARNFLGGKRTKQFDLRIERHAFDFIQEQGAA